MSKLVASLGMLVCSCCMLAELALPARGEEAKTSAGPARTAKAGKSAQPAGAALSQLRTIGQSIARAMTDKKFEAIHAFLCEADRARSSKEDFARPLRRLHELARTTRVELAADDEIVRENRRAGAKTAADLDGLASVLVPLRLHAPGMAGGDSTSVQSWVFVREGKTWCTHLED